MQTALLEGSFFYGQAKIFVASSCDGNAPFPARVRRAKCVRIDAIGANRPADLQRFEIACARAEVAVNLRHRMVMCVRLALVLSAVPFWR
ncbi:hypothetical protein, partial [Xanthomonas perforans]|uniref:hypothetical protein n=1 Tax=Xanthomonas perforans TaxID=442694 RepID=UPI0031C07601|nr:hypothetical protein [Xanthomonas perforans]